jgi:hypothetical protein
MEWLMICYYGDLTIFHNNTTALGPGQSNHLSGGQLPSCMTSTPWTGWSIRRLRAFTRQNPSPVLQTLLHFVSRYQLQSLHTTRLVHMSNNKSCEPNLCWYSLSRSSDLPCLRWCKHWSGSFKGPTWPGECSMARKLLGDRMTRTRKSSNKWNNTYILCWTCIPSYCCDC